MTYVTTSYIDFRPATISELNDIVELISLVSGVQSSNVDFFSIAIRNLVSKVRLSEFIQFRVSKIDTSCIDEPLWVIEACYSYILTYVRYLRWYCMVLSKLSYW